MQILRWIELAKVTERNIMGMGVGVGTIIGRRNNFEMLHNMTRCFYRVRRLHLSSCELRKTPSNLKGKSKSSQEWLSRQLSDPYVKKAHDMNYRARSAFKLIEIDDKEKILKPGQVVVECGAAPGAWTQVIAQRINSDGKVVKKRTGIVIGIDLLPIAPLDGAIFLDGYDFTKSETLQKIKGIVMEKKSRLGLLERSQNSKRAMKMGDDPTSEDANNTPFPIIAATESGNGGNEKGALIDVVLSDMAPNATGQRDTDHPRIIKLVESALMFAIQNGRQGGHFLAKVWDGSEVQRVESCIAKYYDKVCRHKPPSSRRDSSEIFILGKFKK